MEHYYTIEVYHHRKWSDRYSLMYSTKEEAQQRAKDLYDGDTDNYGHHISNLYRIKETTINTEIHEIK